MIRFCLSTLALFAMVRVSPLLAAEDVAPPFLQLDFDEALQRASAEKKLVVIDFYTTWCGPCKMLDRTTWPDAQVQALLAAKAVPLKVDAEKEVALAKRYRVEAYPTIAIIKADGTLLDSYVGYMPAAAFILKFEATLAGKTSLDLANEAVVKAKETGAHEEVRARYDRAKDLARAGKHEDALKEFLWCFDEGMIAVPSYTGVRLSYLLSSIEQLSSAYPPARQALVQRRDAAKREFLAAAKAGRAGRDYSSINRVLGETEETLATFDLLPKGDPRRKAVGSDVYDALVKRHSYEEALEASPDASFESLFSHLEQEARGDGFAKEHPELAVYAKRSVVKQGIDRTTILAAVGRATDAQKLASRVLTIDDSAEAHAKIDAALATAPAK